jgi:hypothetical protein
MADDVVIMDFPELVMQDGESGDEQFQFDGWSDPSEKKP